MDTMEAIYGRRSVRAYSDNHLDHSVIEDLLNAAIWAPSAHNLQPWSFVLVQDRSRLASLSSRAKAQLVREYWDDPRMKPYRELLSDDDFDIFYGAPLLIIICAQPDPLVPVEQCFLAAENLMLAAHARGFGTCCIGWALPVLFEPDVKQELSIPEDVPPALPVIVGSPAELPERPPRDPPRILAWFN